MPTFIDTHCHLTMSHYDADRPEVIKRARDTGVATMITIGTDLENSRRTIALAEEHEFIFAAMGTHPHDVKDIKDAEAAYETLKSLASNTKVVAVGETGLDYHYMHSPAHLQQEHFKWHIETARALNLPVIVHSREAKEDTLKILKEANYHNIRGVLHCFSGDMDMAEQALEMGFYISFSGVVTFKNAETILNILKAVPLDRILTETDAPFLTPHPHRGKRNEPAYVKHVAGKVAEVKGLSIEETCKAILNNAARLFKLNFLSAP